MLVFNRKVGCTARGATGRMIAVIPSGIVVEVAGKIRVVKARHADGLTVCTPREMALSRQDRLQLKANAKTARGELLANGEVVTVKNIRASGEIELTDGRTLPASYRQFVRGYAVTSYGSQGKTVDHVLLGDASIGGATNAQQWYVTISRGRKSVRIFTPDKAELRANITKSGDRTLALDLAPPPARKSLVGEHILRGVKRGREFARRVCLAAMRAWSAATFSNRHSPIHHETPLRSQQTDQSRRTNFAGTVKRPPPACALSPLAAHCTFSPINISSQRRWPAWKMGKR